MKESNIHFVMIIIDVDPDPPFFMQIRIRTGQKRADPADPDPKHWVGSGLASKWSSSETMQVKGIWFDYSEKAEIFDFFKIIRL